MPAPYHVLHVINPKPFAQVMKYSWTIFLEFEMTREILSIKNPNITDYYRVDNILTYCNSGFLL